MNESEEFTLPISNKKVIIKGYVSGAIQSQIQRVINAGSNLKIDFGGKDDTQVKGGSAAINPDAQLNAKEKAYELMVISLDGNSDNVFNRVQELPQGDCDFITEQIEKITTKSVLTPAQKKS